MQANKKYHTFASKNLEKMFIDTHCHLYSSQFDADRKEMIERGLQRGVEKFLLPNIDANSIKSMLELEASHPGICYAMMGIHPCSINENWVDEMKVAKEQMFSRNWIAVGEIGLDYYWDKTYKKEQQDCFRTQINWAKELDIPVVIHSRDSTPDVLEILKSEKTEKLRGIFHCFGGSIEEANEIIALGFKLGIGGVLTFKNSKLDKVLEVVDLEHIVLETDAPYLAPTPYRGKRNESSYILEVAMKLAAIKGVSVKTVEEITTENTNKLFKLNN